MDRPARATAQDREPGRAHAAVQVLDPGEAEAQAGLWRTPGRVAAHPFGFVQLEFGFLLGPPDGRYFVRSPGGTDTEAILVLRTLGAPERRRLRGRRGRELEQAHAEPVPTSRATLVRPEPFGSGEEAEAWLLTLQRDADRADRELELAARRLNQALHAQRVAAADPYVRDVSPSHALVARIGFGPGDELAVGRFQRAWEPPRELRRTKRSMEAPEERFAGILGGREPALACEELVLRARADLEAGRTREAALEARVALEALLAELPSAGDVAAVRGAVGDAANAALQGELPDELARGVAQAVEQMESALRRRRLGA